MNKKGKWIEVPAERHETSTLLGGYVLHHSFCWCKQQEGGAE